VRRFQIDQLLGISLSRVEAFELLNNVDFGMPSLPAIDRAFRATRYANHQKHYVESQRPDISQRSRFRRPSTGTCLHLRIVMNAVPLRSSSQGSGRWLARQCRPLLRVCPPTSSKQHQTVGHHSPGISMIFRMWVLKNVKALLDALLDVHEDR